MQVDNANYANHTYNINGKFEQLKQYTEFRCRQYEISHFDLFNAARV